VDGGGGEAQADEHPPSIYMIEVYIAKDGSEACLSLNLPKAYCAQNGAVKETSWSWSFSGMKCMRRR
jgi:hypothetical protein